MSEPIYSCRKCKTRYFERHECDWCHGVMTELERDEAPAEKKSEKNSEVEV